MVWASRDHVNSYHVHFTLYWLDKDDVVLGPGICSVKSQKNTKNMQLMYLSSVVIMWHVKLCRSIQLHTTVAVWIDVMLTAPGAPVAAGGRA